MSGSASAERALKGSGALFRGAALLLVVGFIFGMAVPEIFALAFGVSLVVGCIAVGWRMFRAIQIRTGELMLLVALLGTVFGIGLRIILPENRENVVATVVLSFFLLCGSFVMIAGGLTNGLLIAQKLKLDLSGDRILLAILFLFHPAAICGSFLCPLIGLVTAVQDPVVAVLSFILWPVSMLIWHQAASLRKSAQAIPLQHP